jgi:hypothetical protein
MLWIIVSQPPLVTTPNWPGEKGVAKVSRNCKHKAQLVSQYVSPTKMGRTPLEGLVMA